MKEFMKFINITSRCATQYRSERLSASSLNGYQGGYILHICRNPGISQDQLAKEIYVNRSNVTRQLALLEENGYVERRQCRFDKRVIEVYPTEKAYAVRPAVLAVFSEWSRYLTEDFTDQEKELLVSMLEKVAGKAAAYADNMGKKDYRL